MNLTQFKVKLMRHPTPFLQYGFPAPSLLNDMKTFKKQLSDIFLFLSLQVLTAHLILSTVSASDPCLLLLYI